MGYELMENFSRPYFATSVSEFWSRWHRSLSTWFRDYLYIPLGGNRVSLGLWIRNTVIVFALSGLWHGASWTFVAWGFLHAAFLVTGRLKDRALGDRLVAPAFLKWLATVSLVAFAWIFFRAHTLREAHYISTHLFSGLPAQLSSPRSLWVSVRALGQPDDILLGILFTAFLFSVEGFQSRRPLRTWLRAQPILLRWGLLYACMFTTILFGVFRHHAFIYFQF
jgi:D-alanyl-lipoteichoic acid acyltransferase DltB (MBOAT superfamily)